MRNLKDRLSHLTYKDACTLLGPQGERLIKIGGAYEIDISSQVDSKRDVFRLNLGTTAVSLSLDPAKPLHLDLQCSSCLNPCEHLGAALSLILEEKITLGLAAPPPERVPMESLSEKELIAQSLEARAEKARTEKMRLKSFDPENLWTDYLVTNADSGRSYRVAMRGSQRGESYCSCPDFRKNTLGTCKHILFLLDKLRGRFRKSAWDIPPRSKDISVYIRYVEDLELRLSLPEDIDDDTSLLLSPFEGKPVRDIRELLRRIIRIEDLGRKVNVYPDAEEFINTRLYRQRVASRVEEIRRDPRNHPLRETLLKAELLPYQLDGIAFAVGAGRAVIADDMGLGKTIQGIGTAELLSRDAHISKVLIVCPASLKSQWRLEIGKFCGRTCQIVLGSAKERAEQYDGPAFFTICNYEQVLRDIQSIEQVPWDLIILDEAQRIKNWETKTSRMIKSLKSPFALVLAGTPLENRLGDLFSIVEFIDDRRLGPAFRFFNRHRVVDERGRSLGYKNLDEVRKALQPVLLRRTRKQVLDELPPRTTEITRIPPTDEQMDIHNGQRKVIQSILSKKYFSEMDLLRLQKSLLICRMASNSTFLVDKQPPGYSSKLEELDNLVGQLAAEADRKIVLFSEWTTMLNLIEPFLQKRKLNFVRLEGRVPQKKRQMLIHQFQKDPECRFFLATNAGSTGLNLQAADTVINVDLPWNPAVLEQRISRIHRMGQTRPVQVFLLITEGTLEESLLGTLSAKHQLFQAVLDPESDVTSVDLSCGIEELKKRLEILLGEKPDAPLDESGRDLIETEARRMAQKQNIARAGGQLMGAAFAFMGELFASGEETARTEMLAGSVKKTLSGLMTKGEDGSLNMSISLPGEGALDNLAKSLARIMEASGFPAP
jgi:superfamily II DNA or RNA helicase